MADDLLVGVGADVAEFRRDRATILAEAQGLQRDIARALQGTQILPDLGAEARAAGAAVITGIRNAVQEGADALRRDVAGALVPTGLTGDFTRLADAVRAGTSTISTALAREGHDAGRALVVALGAELPAVQQVLAEFTRDASRTLSTRLLTDLTPQGLSAGRQLVSGLRTAVQSQQGAIRADIVGSLVPTTLAADFGRLTTTIRASAATLATALGSGGVDAGRALVSGLASGLTGADRSITTFIARASATLTRANLLGDLEQQGVRSGAQLVAGVTRAITSGSAVIQRAITASLVPTNLTGELAAITTGVGREIARITPLLAATGATGGRALVTSLGATLSQGTAVIVRDFSRGAATAVAGLDIFGDLTPAGQRAGVQLLSGLTQTVNREGAALRGTLATALIPTTITGEMGRLTATITSGLRDIPPLFLAAGRTAGATFTATLGTQLNESRGLLTSFARDTSAALTAAITIGDTRAGGEVAGRALARAIATGVAAGSPQIRAALSTALVPNTITADIGRITAAVSAEARELTPLLTVEGTRSGRAYIGAIEGEVVRGAQVLRQLTQGATVGVVVDAAPLRVAAKAQQELLVATTSTTQAMRGLDTAVDAISPQRLIAATTATRTLADAQREWLREARGGSVEAQALWQRQRNAAAQAAAEAKRVASEAGANARQEAAARTQVRAELVKDITTLRLLGATTNATNTAAVAGWRTEAAAIRRQAQEVGLARDQMLRLEQVIQQTERAFARQQAAATRAAAVTAGVAIPSTAGIGAVATQIGTITRNASGARRSIDQVTIAGRSLTSISNRLGPAMVGVSFGLEALARGGTAADTGLRTALRAVASFAAFFGPKGFLISGIAAGTAAILDLFNRSRDEVEATRKKFQSEITEMVRTADTAGLQRQLRDIELGTLTIDDKGIARFTGGLKELKTRAQEINEELAELSGRRDIVAVVRVTELNRELRALTPQIRDKQTQFNKLATTIREFPTLPREITGLPAVNITADTKSASDAIRELRERVAALIETYGQLAGDTTAQRAIAAQLIPLYDQIAAAATRHGVATTEAARAARALKAELSQVAPVQIELARRRLTTDIAPDIPPISVTGLIDKVDVSPALRIDTVIPFDEGTLATSLRRALEGARQAQGQLDFAELLGTRQDVADATENVTIATAGLRREILAASQQIDQSGASDAQKATALALLIRLYREVTNETNIAADAANGFDAALDDIRNVASGVEALAQSLRRAGVEAADLIGSFADLLGAAGQLGASIKSLGTATSVGAKIGAGAAVFAAIVDTARTLQNVANIAFGETAAQRERNELVARNNDALDALRSELKGFGDRIGDTLLAGRAASDIGLRQLARFAQNPIRTIGAGFQDAFNERLAREFGLTLQELNRIAQDNGIELLTRQGRIAADALRQLEEATKLAALAASTFQNTVEDQSFIREARRQIRDVDSDINAALEDSLELFRQFAPELFDRFLAGADAGSAAGRRIIEQAIRDIFELAAAGGIDADLIKAFGSIEEFVNFLLDADRALDDFAETTRQASSDMINVVRGFRDFNLERARFQATREQVTSVIPRPTSAPLAIGAGTAVTTIGSVTFAPEIRIDGRGKDAVQITTEVVTELRRRAKASANPDVRRTVNLLPV